MRTKALCWPAAPIRSAPTSKRSGLAKFAGSSNTCGAARFLPISTSLRAPLRRSSCAGRRARWKRSTNPEPIAEPTVSPLDRRLLKQMYRTMALIRAAEERIADLVEARIVNCPCHLYIGQEAIATGVCAALETSDYVWGGHRSHGHYLAKGGSLNAMMAEIFGKVTGC